MTKTSLAPRKLGLIGIGLMGLPMARNWLKKGFSLSVLPNRNRSMLPELEQLGAHVAQDLAALVQASEVIILMLPTSREVEDVCLRKGGLIDLLGPQNVTIDMTTSEPSSTVKIFNKFTEKSLRFFDSPVTGGVKGAEAASLTLFIGGPREWFDACHDILSAVSKVQSHFGSISLGNVAKIINNFICLGNLAVLSEALPLAARLGLESQQIFETLLSGTASSEMLKVYGPQILDNDFKARYKLAHAHKDIRIANDLVKELKVQLPLLKAIGLEFDNAMNAGLKEENSSAIIKPIEEKLKARFRKSP